MNKPEINKFLVLRKKQRGSLPIGVTKIKSKSRPYIAQCGNPPNRIYLGTFGTPEAAFKAYKIEKELRIKELAEKYKSVLNENVYQALINYKIEITD